MLMQRPASDEESGEPSPTSTRNSDVDLTIVVLGWTFSGKTTLCMRMMGLNPCNDYRASEENHKYGVPFATTTNDTEMTVIYIDTPGGDDAVKIRKEAYVTKPDGYIFVYDVTHFDSFASIENMFLPEIEKITGQEQISVPCLVLGNKVNAATRVPGQILTREVAFSDGEHLSWDIRGNTGSCRFVEVDSLTGQGKLDGEINTFLTTVADHRMNLSAGSNKKKKKKEKTKVECCVLQ